MRYIMESPAGSDSPGRMLFTRAVRCQNPQSQGQMPRPPRYRLAQERAIAWRKSALSTE